MDTTLEKILPHDLELERTVLGAMLLGGEVTSEVRVEDFYLDSHRRIFKIISELDEIDVKPDIATVISHLRRKGDLEACGGPAYIASLTNFIPNMELSPQYAAMLREHWAKRSLIRAANEMLSMGYGQEESSRAMIDMAVDAFDQVTSATERGTGLRPVEEYLSAAYKEIEEISQHKITGAYATGFSELDRLTAGGLKPRTEMILAARPGMGKTAMMVNMLCNMAERGIRIGIFSLEMGGDQLMRRMVASVAQVDLHKMDTGFLNKEDWGKINHAAGRISQYPIWIDDSTGITVADIRARIRRIRPPLQVVAIDYLQLVSPPPKYLNRDEYHQITAVSRALRFMMKSTGISLLALSQLSRQKDRRKDSRPQLSDLRGSGQTEQDADQVLFIHREELIHPEAAEQGLAELILAKQRSGPTGEFQLCYMGHYTKFANLWNDSMEANQQPYWYNDR